MGVSAAEVVMEDMAIGNPASFSAQLALLSLVPRHPYSAIGSWPVIGNCGVIGLMHRSIHRPR
jgi:hypothetical protein